MSDGVIGLDIMGGDHAPSIRVQAAYRAALRGISLMLFGPRALIESLLRNQSKEWFLLPIKITDAPESISMEDDPVEAIQQKKNSSLVEGLKALRANTIHALVSAGNSGAVLVGSVIHVGRLPMVRRPALACFIPSSHNKPLVLDIGASSDIKASCLVDFALMGAGFIHLERNITVPKVGLLSNGSENFKGSLLIQEAHILLRNCPTTAFEFIGNCEPCDIFAGKADVIVTDGFSGNIFIKSAEATMHEINSFFKKELLMGVWNRWLGILMRSLFTKMHTAMTIPGGALLLGLEHPVIIAHGAAQTDDIYNALAYAYELVEGKVITKFSKILEHHYLKNRVEKNK